MCNKSIDKVFESNKLKFSSKDWINVDYVLKFSSKHVKILLSLNWDQSSNPNLSILSCMDGSWGSLDGKVPQE